MRRFRIVGARSPAVLLTTLTSVVSTGCSGVDDDRPDVIPTCQGDECGVSVGEPASGAVDQPDDTGPPDPGPPDPNVGVGIPDPDNEVDAGVGGTGGGVDQAVGVGGTAPDDSRNGNASGITTGGTDSAVNGGF